MPAAHVVVALLALVAQDATAEQPPHETEVVCIVGAGAAGGMVARTLSQLAPQAELHVFERARQAGGRASVCGVAYGGAHHAYECGGSVIHTANRLAWEVAQRNGLATRRGAAYVGLRGPPTMGIFNFGTGGFDFELGPLTKWPLNLLFVREAKMLWHHGPSLLRLAAVSNAAVSNFGRIYGAVRGSTAGFPSLKPLLEAIDLYAQTRTRLRDVVQDQSGTVRASDELATFADAVSRVNYGQSDISALAGIISLSAKSADLWSVEGGNHRLVEALLNESGARVSLNTHVGAIIKTTPAQCAQGARSRPWLLSSGRGGARVQACDAVVVSLPLHQRNRLNFDIPGFNASTPRWPGALRVDVDTGTSARRFTTQFQRTVTTLVAGRLNPAFFAYAFVPAKGFALACAGLLALCACAWLGDTRDVDGEGRARGSGFVGPRGSVCLILLPVAAVLGGTVVTYAAENNLLHLWGAGAPPPFDRSFSIPDVILTTEHPSAPFSVLGLLEVLDAQQGVGAYKIMSRTPVPAAVLDQLFVYRNDTEVRDWLAYPQYGHANAAWEDMPFVLDDHGLYYTSAIESAGSAIELSMVAGYNAAHLVAEFLSHRPKHHECAQQSV